MLANLPVSTHNKHAVCIALRTSYNLRHEIVDETLDETIGIVFSPIQ